MSILLMLTVCGVCGQVRNTDKLSPAKRFKMATLLLREGSYYNGSQELEKLVKISPDNIDYLTKLADAYFLARNYEKAESVYEKLTKRDKKDVTLARFRYAECLKYNGKYSEALRESETFLKESKHRPVDKKPYKLYADQEVKSCSFAMQNIQSEDAHTVVHAGNILNSAYSDFAPVRKGDTLLFSSLATDTVAEISTVLPNTRHVRLYMSYKEQEQWVEPVLVSGAVDSEFRSTANAVFSSDHKRLYFSRCRSIGSDRHCMIYMSKVNNGRFSKPVKLPAINAKGYTSTQPHIANMQIGKMKREVLFYASDRKGGRGGMDVWYSILNNEGIPGRPVNAGRHINSVRNEITPFYDEIADELYFSSDFHPGFGGYDVFRVAGDLRNLSAPINMGTTVNSRVDDTYFRIYDDKKGYMVSNRVGGLQLMSPTCCDDIYEVVLKEKEPEKENIESDPGMIRMIPAVIVPDEVESEEVYTCERLGRDIRIKDRAGLKVILNYETNDVDFIDRKADDLDCMAGLLAEYTDIKIKITAYTDDVGTEQYNLRLSRKRAQAIQQYFVRKGIKAERISVEYFGESKPLAPNLNDDGAPNEKNRALNRRTEISIIN